MKARKQRRAPAERPNEIVEAALALFVEKGFAGTRLDDVAARAGLSKAAIYLYFEDKMALFQGVIRQAIGSNLLTVEPGRRKALFHEQRQRGLDDLVRPFGRGAALLLHHPLTNLPVS
jgi:AcrR family transcriptional regulator